jgi:hypothetical protein
MEFVIVLVVLAVVVFVITGPLRKAYRPSGNDAAAIARVDELEAAREAKYREIRDAELDHRTGKLSDEDFARIDAQLRAEALDILDQLDKQSAPTSDET